MNILHVGKYYPPYRGGMETVLQNVAEGLLARGCGVTLVTAGTGPADVHEPLTTPDGAGRGRLVRVGAAAVVNSQPLTSSLVTALRREIQRLGPDVLHLHLPNPLAAAAWWILRAEGSLHDLPTAVWYHADITRQRWGRRLVGPVRDACLRGAAGICVSSATLAARSPVLAPHVDRVGVVPFGVRPAPWIDIEPSLDGPLLFVGRLVPYKGVPVLLQALAGLPGIRLTLVGEGPQRRALGDLAARLGVAARVDFVGSLASDAIAGHLARASALVLPSVDVSEAFGLVQLEAMAAGVPVVTTDLPTGIREVGAPDETCLLVPPGDAPALEAALGRLLGDDRLRRRLGDGGRERFLARFTRDRMIDRLLEWYAALPGVGCAARSGT